MLIPNRSTFSASKYNHGFHRFFWSFSEKLRARLTSALPEDGWGIFMSLHVRGSTQARQGMT